MKKKPPVNVRSLLLWIAIPELVGIIGSIFTVSQIPTWYATLQKPIFTPPGWAFGPAWIVMYALMGLAIYRIRQKGTEKPAVRQATALFILQLLFNAVWSFIFFNSHNIYGGLIDIAILWVLIFLLMVKFYEIDKVAGHLIVPYFLWVFFALSLNYGVWILNP